MNSRPWDPVPRPKSEVALLRKELLEKEKKKKRRMTKKKAKK